MKKTKAKIREHNGKVFFFFSFFFFTFLISGYLFGFFAIVQNFTTTVTPTSKELVTKEKTTKERPFLEFLDAGDHRLFVGGQMNGKIHEVQGIEFDTIDSISIKYRIDFLENWKQKKQIKGIAILKHSTLQADQISIEFRTGEIYPAYQFIDNSRICPLEILISKQEYPNSSFARVRENCNGDKIDLTALMYEK